MDDRAFIKHPAFSYNTKNEAKFDFARAKRYFEIFPDDVKVRPEAWKRLFPSVPLRHSFIKINPSSDIADSCLSDVAEEDSDFDFSDIDSVSSDVDSFSMPHYFSNSGHSSRTEPFFFKKMVNLTLKMKVILLQTQKVV